MIINWVFERVKIVRKVWDSPLAIEAKTNKPIKKNHTLRESGNVSKICSFLCCPEICAGVRHYNCWQWQSSNAVTFGNRKHWHSKNRDECGCNDDQWGGFTEWYFMWRRCWWAISSRLDRIKGNSITKSVPSRLKGRTSCDENAQSKCHNTEGLHPVLLCPLDLLLVLLLH